MGAGGSAARAAQPVAAESSPMVRKDCREALRETRAFPDYLEVWLRALKPLGATAFGARQDFLRTRKQWHAQMLALQAEMNKTHFATPWEPQWAKSVKHEEDWASLAQRTASSDVRALLDEGVVDLCLTALTRFPSMFAGFEANAALKQRARPLLLPKSVPYYVSQRYYAPFRRATTESMQAGLCRAALRILAGCVIEDRVVLYLRVREAWELVSRVTAAWPVDDRVQQYAELIREGLRGYNHPVEAIWRYVDTNDVAEIVNLMRQHEGVFKVQEAGLWAVKRLLEAEDAEDAATARMHLDYEAIGTLMAPLRRWRPRVQLHAVAAAVVRLLATADASLAGSLGRAGAVDALMLALKDVRGFVSRRERADGVPAKAARSAHRIESDPDEVAQHALWALEALRLVDSNRDRMLGHGLPRVMREIAVDNRNAAAGGGVAGREAPGRYIVVPRALLAIDWDEQGSKVAAARAQNRAAAWQAEDQLV